MLCEINKCQNFRNCSIPFKAGARVFQTYYDLPHWGLCERNEQFIRDLVDDLVFPLYKRNKNFEERADNLSHGPLMGLSNTSKNILKSTINLKQLHSICHYTLTTRPIRRYNNIYM